MRRSVLRPLATLAALAGLAAATAAPAQPVGLIAGFFEKGVEARLKAPLSKTDLFDANALRVVLCGTGSPMPDPARARRTAVSVCAHVSRWGDVAAGGGSEGKGRRSEPVPVARPAGPDSGRDYSEASKSSEWRQRSAGRRGGKESIRWRRDARATGAGTGLHRNVRKWDCVLTRDYSEDWRNFQNFPYE